MEHVTGKENRVTQAAVRLCVCVAGALLFLAVVYVIVYHDEDWRHLWLPISITDDEVMYNRQVAGILEEGIPRGYFGYNETHAVLGSFSVWGPIVMYLYALPGALLGPGVNMMVWCNVFFSVLGWELFINGTRLTWKRQLVFAAGIFCLWFPLKQIFSGMSESLQYCCVLAILGSTVALQRRVDIRWFAVLAISCTVTTLTRAYTVLFWLFPIVLLWNRRRKWAWLSTVMAFLSVAGYLVVSLWFSSPYFSEGGVDYTAVYLFVSGSPIKAFTYEFARMWAEFQELWNLYIYPELQDQGRTFLSIFVLICMTAVCAVVDIKKGRTRVLKISALICTVSDMLLLFALYDAGAFQRQFALLSLLLLGVLVYENGKYSLIGLLPLLLMLPVNFNPGKLPTYRSDIDKQIQIINSSLAESRQSVDSADPWDHTLAYAYADGVFHGYLYAVPAGMGIEFDFNTYIADPANTIHSRYAMVGHGTDAEARLVRDGWQELVSTEDLIVYEQPQAARE